MGPIHRAIIATNFESPLPIASFLNIYLAKYRKHSNNKNDIAAVNTPLAMKNKSINFAINISWDINPKRPEIKPKFIKPWGIQNLFISIKDMQIKRDKNIQLINIFKTDPELEL